MAALFVGAKDGEYGAFLAGLGQQAVHKHRLLGESEGFPGFPFVGAVSGEKALRELPAAAPVVIPLPCRLLELVGLGALRDGHKNATVVPPGVIVGSRQRLEEKGC